jgi:predicted amidophosphoribosyltransferase
MNDKKKNHCMICGMESEKSICDACAAKVQGEAVDKKQKIEKKGKVDTGRT